MISNIPYPSIHHVALALREGHELSPVLRTFLTYLPEGGIAEAIAQPPLLLGPLYAKGAYYDAYLAALGEYLANRAGLPTPAWTLEPSRVLTEDVVPQPRFAALHEVLKAETPPAFRRHGIVISANALEVA